MDIKEAIVSALKEIIVPELNDIKKNIKDLEAKLEFTNKRLDDVNKRLDDMNAHLIDQSRRIDAVRSELTEKVESVRSELTTRIDETNRRIDQLVFQMKNISQEMERIKREEKTTADILYRIERLERRVMGE